MRDPRYHDPAYSLIEKFAEGRRLGKGIDAVAEITGVSRVQVYRWMRPKAKGGTEGMIPSQHLKAMFEYASRKRLPVRPADFFGVRAA
jgi:hypothetical protein